MDFLRNPQGESFKDEPDLLRRVEASARQFKEVYGRQPAICVRSPGRAEILGNHTDYNNGFALAAAISRSIVALFAKRTDNKVRIASDAFGGRVEEFSLDKIEADPQAGWTNYIRGVANELLIEGKQIGGADVLLSANLPSSGGVSSSAALELASGVGLLSLYGLSFERLAMALLCKRAENGPLVNTPCGLLDQASVAFGERGKVVLLDFFPPERTPLGVKTISADLSEKGYSFVLSVDNEVRRNLGDTGYPARRRMCEASVPILAEILGKNVSSLRDVSVEEYESVKQQLEQRGGEVMRMRVEHVVYENMRVLDGARALEQGDVEAFGNALSQSGRSALDLYGLDEKTPELTFLVETERAFKGITGTRNMGGGFSAITLSLMKKDLVAGFVEEIGAAYESKYGRALHFIEFSCTQGVEVL